MSDGTQLANVTDDPQEEQAISQAARELTGSQSNPKQNWKKGIIKLQLLQEAFVAVVPPVQALETPPAPQESSPETGQNSGGKSGLGSQNANPAGNYSGVNMTEGEVLEDNDLNAGSPQSVAAEIVNLGDEAKRDAINEDREKAQEQYSDAADQAVQDALGATLSAAGIVTEDDQVKEKDPQTPNLPENTLVSDGTSSDLSSDPRPDFNNNTQTVLDNIAGQTESVKGSASGLKMANDHVSEVQAVLDELQGEAPVQGEGESDEDYSSRLKAYQDKVEDTQKDLGQAKSAQELSKITESDLPQGAAADSAEMERYFEGERKSLEAKAEAMESESEDIKDNIGRVTKEEALGNSTDTPQDRSATLAQEIETPRDIGASAAANPSLTGGGTPPASGLETEDEEGPDDINVADLIADVADDLKDKLKDLGNRTINIQEAADEPNEIRGLVIQSGETISFTGITTEISRASVSNQEIQK